MRWEHPERRLLQPDEFISLAEETGLIVPIGTRGRESCRRAQRWSAERVADEPLVVRVNVSARQLMQDKVADVVQQVLEEPAWSRRTSAWRSPIEDPETYALNLSVTAEGVETTEQLGNLQNSGCDTAQGFLFSRPEHPDVVERLLLEEGTAEAAPSEASV